MAKLALLLATFALVLFLANASIYRTTITDDNEDNPRHQESSCRQQIRKQNHLKHCMEYMEEQCSSSSCHRYNFPDVPIERCCKQLEKLERQCRCPGLKQAVQRQMEEGELGREEMQELHQVAQQVMAECELRG